MPAEPTMDFKGAAAAVIDNAAHMVFDNEGFENMIVANFGGLNR